MKLTLIISSIIYGFSTGSAWAEPALIDVVGIIPGVSTQESLSAIQYSAGQFNVYTIGGYNLICGTENSGHIIHNLTCTTGLNIPTVPPKYNSFDTKTAKQVSNKEVYAGLLIGFTRKLGPPSKSSTETETSSDGVKFNYKVSSWTDKKGNTLVITETHVNKYLKKIDNIHERVGALILNSAERNEKIARINKEIKKKTDTERQF